MTETEKKMHWVSFMGHRPKNLTRQEKAIKKDWKNETRLAAIAGLNVFIT